MRPENVPSVPVVISAPNEKEEVMLLEQKTFRPEEWREIVKDFFMLKEIGRKLTTIECRMCGKRTAIHVDSVKSENSKSHRLMYRCLSCDELFINNGAIPRRPTELISFDGREPGAPQAEINDVTWVIHPDGKAIKVESLNELEKIFNT